MQGEAGEIWFDKPVWFYTLLKRMKMRQWMTLAPGGAVVPMAGPRDETEKLDPMDGVATCAPQTGRSHSTRNLSLAAGVLALLGIALVYGWMQFVLPDSISIQGIEDEIQSWGPYGAVASICLMVMHSFVPFPSEFIAVANGMLFGVAWGVLITWTGAMLGAFAAFGIARLLGRPFVERILRKHDMQRIDRWTSEQGWQLLLISRFIPLIAFNLINYAAGLTRVTWFTFAWTTGVGILPITILMVLAGHNIDLMTGEAWLLLIAAGALLWLVVRRKMPRRERVPDGEAK